MKILLFIMLYLIIGLISAALILKESTKVTGQISDNFFDLDEDRQSMVLFTFLVWPVVYVIIAIFIALNLVVIIASLRKKELDDEKTDEKRNS